MHDRTAEAPASNPPMTALPPTAAESRLPAGMHLDPRQVPISLMQPAMDAGQPAEPPVVAQCRNCGHELALSGGADLPAALVGEQTSDHAPIESVYGVVCRTCVNWLDDEGASEFGIAIPAPWPCGVAQAAGIR